MVLVNVETFKTDLTVFIGNAIIYLTDIISVYVMVYPLLLKISLCEIKEKYIDYL